MQPMTSRGLEIDGLVNARDLGGLQREDGGVTPSGVFFRSENIDWAKPSGWDQLHALGIRSVVDIRQPGERDRDLQDRPDWLTTLSVDHDGLENTEFWANYWDNGLVGTALYFLPHMEAMPERTGAVLDALAQAPTGGVLFHCMGGRDRTGLISLILLTAVQTVVDEMVDDYMETVRCGDIRAATGNRNNMEPLLEELCQKRGTTTEGAFRYAVRDFNLAKLFDSAGVSEQTRHAILSWRGAIQP